MAIDEAIHMGNPQSSEAESWTPLSDGRVSMGGGRGDLKATSAISHHPASQGVARYWHFGLNFIKATQNHTKLKRWKHIPNINMYCSI